MARPPSQAAQQRSAAVALFASCRAQDGSGGESATSAPDAKLRRGATSGHRSPTLSTTSQDAALSLFSDATRILVKAYALLTLASKFGNGANKTEDRLIVQVRLRWRCRGGHP